MFKDTAFRRGELTINNITTFEFIHTHLNVYNLMGNQVYPVVTRNEESFTISKGSLSKGIYICKLVNESGVLSVTKMVIN